jgi:hypothetical protein
MPAGKAVEIAFKYLQLICNRRLQMEIEWRALL